VGFRQTAIRGAKSGARKRSPRQAPRPSFQCAFAHNKATCGGSAAFAAIQIGYTEIAYPICIAMLKNAASIEAARRRPIRPLRKQKTPGWRSPPAGGLDQLLEEEESYSRRQFFLYQRWAARFAHFRTSVSS